MNLKDIENKYYDLYNKINGLKSNSINSEFTIGAALISRIMEDTQAIIILLRKQCLKAPIYSILRNMLEAIIDLDNLFNADGYSDYLICLDLYKNRIKLFEKKEFKNLIKDKEDFSKLKLNYEDYKSNFKILKNKLITKYKEKYFEKYKEKYKVKYKIKNSILFKFDLCDNSNLYHSIYFILCNESHNSLTSLEHNYIINNDKSIEICVFNDLNQEELEGICETIDIILNSLTEKIKLIKKL